MDRCVFILAAALAAVPATAFAQPVERSGRYIVQLKEDVSLASFAAAFVPDARLANQRLHGYHSPAVLGAVMTLERQHGFRSYAFYSRALRGFAAALTPSQVRTLAASPLVASIEPDDPVRLTPIAVQAQTIDWGIFTTGASQSSVASGDGMGTVSGVHVYVIDSGVDAAHPDINLVEHVNFAPAPNADCNGHGTGVAGIIAARDNTAFTVGVVPGAPVHAVKVISCDGLGFPSWIASGVDWVAANAVKPAVANMSLGSLIRLSAIDTAVRNAAASGVFFALAAGNGNPFTGEPLNACNTSPAGVGYDTWPPNGIIAVGATDQTDTEADFSNFGPCVQLWAPGVAVTSTWLTTAGGMITASGTSFASPYVAGAAALLLSRGPWLSPASVEFLLRYAADVPGTTSKDGAVIRRLQIRYF